ncbi:MAG: MaoC family dehydratase N-terminal domain-containing protein [Chloroflexi bacterium]|nr:MaoC family dehydratase N-terminal domain-containing protein [Chloroflexota bacterium]
MGNVETAAGSELDKVRYTLDRDLIADYLSVVGGEPALYQPGDLVPPTAMAALGMRTLLNGLGLPAGAVHVAQELTMHRTATWDQNVVCSARVAQTSQRKDGRFLVLEFEIAGEDGSPILEGRTIVIAPGQNG